MPEDLLEEELPSTGVAEGEDSYEAENMSSVMKQAETKKQTTKNRKAMSAFYGDSVKTQKPVENTEAETFMETIPFEIEEETTEEEDIPTLLTLMIWKMMSISIR